MPRRSSPGPRPKPMLKRQDGRVEDVNVGLRFGDNPKEMREKARLSTSSIESYSPEKTLEKHQRARGLYRPQDWPQ